MTSKYTPLEEAARSIARMAHSGPHHPAYVEHNASAIARDIRRAAFEEAAHAADADLEEQPGVIDRERGRGDGGSSARAARRIAARIRALAAKDPA